MYHVFFIHSSVIEHFCWGGVLLDKMSFWEGLLDEVILLSAGNSHLVLRPQRWSAQG